MKISLIQVKVLKTPDENIVKIDKMVNRAALDGAEIVVLPEMCCCEYTNSAFIKNAMKQDDLFIKSLSLIAKKYSVILVAGSVPEKSEDKIYNTSFVFNSSGEVIAKHRKVHLFDINVKDGISFKESDTFSPGNSFTSFDTKWGKIGLIICFDIRFPDFIKKNSKELSMIIVPASFNMTTGPAHWELLFRARAVDSQVFMAGCAAACDKNSSYHSYAHSLICDPWGNILKMLNMNEDILSLDIDLKKVQDIRNQLPLYNSI